MKKLKSIWPQFLSFLEKIQFTTGNGWKHFCIFICLAYCVLYWGLSDYGYKTVEWPTSMWHSLATQSFVAQLCLFAVGGFLVNLAYELGALFFAGIKVSLIDCCWAAFGSMIAVCLFSKLPSNYFIMMILLAQIVFVAILILNFIYKKLKSKLKK